MANGNGVLTGKISGSGPRSRRFYKWLAIFSTLFCIGFMFVTLAMALTLWIHLHSPIEWPKASGSMYATYKKASIVTDNGLCSGIGRDVMLDGGNAIDAAIAGLFCTGVVNPQSSGVGGGLLMAIYNATTNRCVTLDAREAAPLSSTQTMYAGDTHAAVHGYKAIGVPGEVHGLWTAYSRFGSGRVSWSRLVQPAVKLARDGFPVSSNLAMLFEKFSSHIIKNPAMERNFLNPSTGKMYTEGEILKRPELAIFLEHLGNTSNAIDFFYHGTVAKTMTNELSSRGGIITMEDFQKYKTLVDESPIESEGLLSEGLVMCGPRPPAGTSIVKAIVGTMAQFYNGSNSVDLNDPLIYHRLIEAEKFAYAQRTKLGDEMFVPEAGEVARNISSPGYVKLIASLLKDKSQPLDYYSPDKTVQKEDHGTSHISAIDKWGNAVAVTSSVNQYFGALRASDKFGFIWNDEMDDFSTPGQLNSFGFAPSPANFIAPQKRPQSSMSPIVIYNRTSSSVVMSIGASGGARIISAIAQTVIRTLLFGQTVKEAVDAPRIHNQFVPTTTEYELGVPNPILDRLINDHRQNMTSVEKSGTSVQILLFNQTDGFIYGNSDFRRKTATFPAGF